LSRDREVLRIFPSASLNKMKAGFECFDFVIKEVQALY
jgi:hypothetical protein